MTFIYLQFAYLLNLDVVPHHVVGWSMGGSVAALYAAKYPQLVRQLTLIAPLSMSVFVCVCVYVYVFAHMCLFYVDCVSRHMNSLH